MLSYPEQAAVLRSEADRNEQTARYLRAASRIQTLTAAYIEKQAGRGEDSLCEGALSGMLDLLKRPEQAIKLSGVE